MKFSQRMNLPPAGMQLAPMIDILFLLIIYFVVATSYARYETELKISVPAASNGQEPKRAIGEIVVNVRDDGTILVNAIILTRDQLYQKLKTIHDLYPDQAVILRGDEKVPYGKIAELLDTCQKAGIWNVAFATKKAEN